MISYNVFMSFVDDNGEASKLLSKDCYKRWMASRRTTPKQPEESFRRVLTAHVCGVDGRRPFPPKVEASLLKVLRKKEVWDCFKDTPYSIGIRGFRNQGLHEASAKSNHKGNLRSRARKKYFTGDEDQDCPSGLKKRRRKSRRESSSSEESDDDDARGSGSYSSKKSRRPKSPAHMPAQIAYAFDAFGRPISYQPSPYMYPTPAQMQGVKMIPYPVQSMVHPIQAQYHQLQTLPSSTAQTQPSPVTPPTTLPFPSGATSTSPSPYLPVIGSEQYIQAAITQAQAQQQLQQQPGPYLGGGT